MNEEKLTLGKRRRRRRMKRKKKVQNSWKANKKIILFLMDYEAMEKDGKTHNFPHF